MTLGNDNGTDGQTDRVRRNMRPPPREEGRIICDVIARRQTVVDDDTKNCHLLYAHLPLSANPLLV